MKVTLYGASGMIGSRILDELVSRGHQVTAVVRNPSKITRKDVVMAAGNVLDARSVATTAKGANAVISSFAPPQDQPNHAVEAVRTLSSGLKEAGVRRLLMVGGAGSLEVKPGVQLVDTPEFPAAWKSIALAHRGCACRAPGNGPRLDLSEAGGLHPAGRANRKIPSGRRFAAD